MAEKKIKTRIQNKHDLEANWLNATGFIPLAGELIVYDVDDTHDAPRFKVGDGVLNAEGKVVGTNVNDLPFITAETVLNIVNGSKEGGLQMLNSTATGANAFAEGEQTQANGDNSHTEGVGTIANKDNQHVEGKYNRDEDTALHIVGCGVDANNRDNCFTAGVINGEKYIKIGNTFLKESELTVPEIYVGTDVSAMINNPSFGPDYEENIEFHKDGVTWKVNDIYIDIGNHSIYKCEGIYFSSDEPDYLWHHWARVARFVEPEKIAELEQKIEEIKNSSNIIVSETAPDNAGVGALWIDTSEIGTLNAEEARF